VSAVLVVRGTPLPVVDLREKGASGGDVLVLVDEGSDALGVAVDRVLAVLPGEALDVDDAPLPAGLPSYVRAVLRAPGSERPVLLVELRALAASVKPAARSRATKRT
jgi:chemotaxis signal transduction protein